MYSDAMVAAVNSATGYTTGWGDMARTLRAVKMFVKKHSTELEQDPTVAPKWWFLEVKLAIWLCII